MRARWISLLIPNFVRVIIMAERGGFEPPIPYGIHAFQACALGHYATSPETTAGVYGDFIKMQILEYSYVYDFGCYFPAFRYNLSFFIIYETTIDCDLRICSFFYPDHSVSLDRIYHSPSTLYYSSYWVINITFFATIFLRNHSYFTESESIGRVGNCRRGYCFLSC